MKKDFTEKHIIELFEDRVFPNAQEEVTGFSLDQIVAGTIKKRNGSDFLVNCAMDINEYGILVVFLDNIKPDKDVTFHHFKFSDMQGIKVTSRGIYYNVTVQFVDGRNYLFEFPKGSTTKLPNQRENIQSFISILKAQGLHDMKNTIHKQNVKANRKMGFSYVSTLVVFLLVAVFFSANVFPNSQGLMIVVLIVTGIIHFILFFISFVFLYTRKDRPFVKEFNQIMKEYKETNNNEKLLTGLLNMNTRPKTQDSKNTLYLTMSNVLQQNDRPEDAEAYLDKIQTTDEQVIELVKEHRKGLDV